MRSCSGVRVVVTDVAVIFCYSLLRGQGGAPAAGFGWFVRGKASEIADGGFKDRSSGSDLAVLPKAQIPRLVTAIQGIRG